MDEIKAVHKEFTGMLLNKEIHWGKPYVYAGTKTLKDWYNNTSGRTVCERTIYLYQARLKVNKYIKKISRRIKNPDGTWKIQTSITSILPAGLESLKRLGVDIKAAMQTIKDKMAAAKKESLGEGSPKDSGGALTDMKGVVKDVMKKLKPGY